MIFSPFFADSCPVWAGSVWWDVLEQEIPLALHDNVIAVSEIFTGFIVAHGAREINTVSKDINQVEPLFRLADDALDRKIGDAHEMALRLGHAFIPFFRCAGFHVPSYLNGN